MDRGIFVVIEGLDRCGKSTQCDLLLKHYKNSTALNFPDRSTQTGKRIDMHLKGEGKFGGPAVYSLFNQNRWEKAQFIVEELEKGKDIICSRYSYSGIAYGVANGREKEFCISMEMGLPKPDLIFLIDIEPEETAKRSGYGTEIYDKIEFQRKVKDELEVLALSDVMVSVRLDGTKSIGELHAECVEWIEKQRVWSKKEPIQYFFTEKSLI